MKKLLYVLLLFCIITPVRAQNPSGLSSAEILQGLQKLNVTGTVLYIAAHPDDENTRLLAYMSRERNLRTGYLSLTRGDGGQNLVGKEQGAALGLIRTQELLAARRIDGAEQFFTRANDFGYSKTPEETFRIWNKDSILADVVWCIRNFRPDVIICRFPTTGEGGHGHHTASAILAEEAYDAAADPKRFPEQLKYVKVWQVKRVVWNTFNWNNNPPPEGEYVKLDVGKYNALLGKSYGEIAAQSRSMHKSQGFGAAATRGETFEYFKPMKGDPAKEDLFEGIDQSWKRVPGADKIPGMINAVIAQYDALNPEKSASALSEIHSQISALKEGDHVSAYWRNHKLQEAQNLLFASLGLWLETFATDYTVIPGKPADVTVQVVMRNPGDLKLNKVSWAAGGDSSLMLKPEPNKLYTFRHKELVPQNLEWSNPYWLNSVATNGLFHISSQLLIGVPENTSQLMTGFELEYNNRKYTVHRPVIYKHTDPVKGEVYRPLEVLPAATVAIPESNFIFTDRNPRSILLSVLANTDSIDGKLEVKVPAGWKAEIKSPQFVLQRKNEIASIEVIITPGPDAGKLSASVIVAGKRITKSIRRIEYDHIPYQFILSEAEAGLIPVDLRKGGERIGYIEGAGDDVPAALMQAGYNVTVLSDAMLASDDLSVYDAIVTGIRAYNIDERLQGFYNRLMDYVRNGGNMIVQYNTNSRVGPLSAKMGPYPFTVSRDRVTDENAEVRFLAPEHPVLNFPNKITSADFNGWKQERGIYFATVHDSAYTEILSMNDPGEKPLNGSLIVAPYGRGNFVYTGLAFFRELPAGVPGAYRLFANLLALPSSRE